jgi:ribonuclease III
MFQELEGRIGHSFQRQDLLEVALTHRSYFFEHKKTSPGHFERLEFLGDAVLDMILSEILMTRFTQVDEGTLSKWRASLVNEATLGEIAKDLGIANHLFLGKSETRENARPRLLGSALEAVIAAMYLDAGIDKVKEFIGREFESRILNLDDQNQFATDFKTRLQELTQKRLRTVPEYRLVSSHGPEHAKQFRYEVLVQEKPLGEGEGNSRKSAEQAAARNALESMQKDTQEQEGAPL